MSRYLVLVDAPLDGEVVRSRLAAMGASGASFHVVVPARPLNDDERQMVALEGTEADAMDSPEMVAARWRLRSATDAMTAAGLRDLTAQVGEPDPLEAIDRACASEHFNAIVVVTRPAGMKSWVHLDLPHRVARHVDEPVIHIEVEPLKL